MKAPAASETWLVIPPPCFYSVFSTLVFALTPRVSEAVALISPASSLGVDGVRSSRPAPSCQFVKNITASMMPMIPACGGLASNLYDNSVVTSRVERGSCGISMIRVVTGYQQGGFVPR